MSTITNALRSIRDSNLAHFLVGRKLWALPILNVAAALVYWANGQFELGINDWALAAQFLAANINGVLVTQADILYDRRGA